MNNYNIHITVLVIRFLCKPHHFTSHLSTKTVHKYFTSLSVRYLQEVQRLSVATSRYDCLWRCQSPLIDWRFWKVSPQNGLVRTSWEGEREVRSGHQWCFGRNLNGKETAFRKIAEVNYIYETVIKNAMKKYLGAGFSAAQKHKWKFLVLILALKW